MAFKSNNRGTGGSDVDWNAMNAHVIEVVGTAKKAKSVVGVISGIYELGIQRQEDAKMEWQGTPEQEAKAIEEKPLTYFEDGICPKTGKEKRYKRWPQKSVRSIAIAVDFPQFMVDKGQFFGESNPAPLRLLLNGEFTPKGSKVKGLGRVYGLNYTKIDTARGSEWTLKLNSLPYRMAVDTDLIEQGQPFVTEDLPDLVGKAVQFQIRVYEKNGFLQEDIKYQGVIPDGLPIPELDEKYLHAFEFDVPDQEEVIKQLRVSVINTIKQAENYEGNVIQAQIENARGKPDNTSKPAAEDKAEAPKQEAKTETKAEAPAAGSSPKPNMDHFDEHVPF